LLENNYPFFAWNSKHSGLQRFGKANVFKALTAGNERILEI
jgi:hypothetical protein